MFTVAFIHEFLSRLSQIEPHEKTHSVCQTAYNDTLAQYHPWLVRKGKQIYYILTQPHE